MFAPVICYFRGLDNRKTSIDAFWWRGVEGWLNQHIFRIIPITEVDTTFFFYLLRYLKPNFVAIARNKQTTGLGHVTRRDLENIEAGLPDNSEQRAIAHILGSLDDKIELNRRMNETLEAMAQALFKSWFVDFDPVHAKATLKRHDAHLSLRQEDFTKFQSNAPSHTRITPPLRGSRQDKGASPPSSRWGVIKRQYSQQTLQYAKALRQNQTNAEGLLWHYLRNKQLDGHKFRRQQPMGPYIVDFACLPRKLIVELDGGQHAKQEAYDEKRDTFLKDKGYRILRIWNNEVFENCFGVLESIYNALPHHPPLEGGSKDASLSGRGSPPPHQPSPAGSVSATPPRGGSEWTPERARAYLDSMDDDIMALFPDSFEDSELGKIPKGWEVKTFGECFNLTMGQSPPGSTYNDHGQGLPFFQGRTDFGFRFPENRKFCTAPTRVAQLGDTLVSVRAPVGDINMAWEQCCIGRGVAALQHKSVSYSFTYYFAWAIQEKISVYEHTGTVFGAINRKQFEELPGNRNGSKLIEIFDACVHPIDVRIRRNISESRIHTA